MPASKKLHKTTTTERLLRKAHDKTTASHIYNDKFLHKPLLLHSNAAASGSHDDAREARRAARVARQRAKQSRKPKPLPLSAKEKRKLCIYDIPKHEARYSFYTGLWRLWCGYVRDILGLALNTSTAERERSRNEQAKEGKASEHSAVVGISAAGPKLASADFHGAAVTCVRSRCVSRVGVRGIVVRDLRGVFVIVTEANCVKTLPKEHSIFQLLIPLYEPRNDETPFEVDATQDFKKLNIELHGDQFQTRAPDRANKKFKMHYNPVL